MSLVLILHLDEVNFKALTLTGRFCYMPLAFIVMDLGDESLAKFIERPEVRGRSNRRHVTYVDPPIRKHIWRQLVSITHTLTTNDIVHMDLKPDNLIVFGQTIKIADLGISKKPEMLG
jgi:serine/threonine protein kinase